MGIRSRIKVEITSADISSDLKAINERGIRIHGAEPVSDLTLRFFVDRDAYPKLKLMAEKRGFSLGIIRQSGIFWRLRRLVRRPVLVVFILVLLIAAIYLPSRVLFVQVEGNVNISTKQILAAAAESGIGFGASRREVRSEKMKNALLSEIPELQWAGVNTYGCVAVISVRERAVSNSQEQTEGVSSIVAARDGVILSCTVTRGSGACIVGQAVREGQLLISGYTDHGLSVTATRAEGEILARTRREITVISPSSEGVRCEQLGELVKYSLQIGKKRINFYKGSGISDGSCVKMYTKYVLTLPGGFQLPVSIQKETILEYEVTDRDREEEIASRELSDFSDSYLQSQMVAGVILERSEVVSFESGLFRLDGTYDCIEQIGRRRQEQIGEYHGKTD